jgi:hypothetical protein
VLHRGLDRDGEGPRPAARILPGHNASDARHRERGRGIDRHQLGMRMRRPQDRGVQDAPRHRQIVGKPAAAAQQIGILETPQLLPGRGACHRLILGHRPLSAQSPRLGKQPAKERGIAALRWH